MTWDGSWYLRADSTVIGNKARGYPISNTAPDGARSTGKEVKSTMLIARNQFQQARLAQLVEHQTSDLRVVGSRPTMGKNFSFCILPLSKVD